MSQHQQRLSRTPDHEPERTARLTRPSNAQRDNRFAIDEARVPNGMTLEWKRVSLLGQPDTRNQVVAAQFHWKPCPHSVQPQILGHLATREDQPIIVDGQQLMMRPTYLCEEAHEERQDAANYTIAQQLGALRAESREQVGAKNTKFKREFVPTQPVD